MLTDTLQPALSTIQLAQQPGRAMLSQAVISFSIYRQLNTLADQHPATGHHCGPHRSVSQSFSKALVLVQ